MGSNNRADGLLHIVFINVNRDTIGDSTLVVYPDGYTMLVDAGVPGEGLRTVLPILHKYGVNTIDRFVISHMHNDHFGGLMELLKSPEISFGEVWWSPIPLALYKKYESQYAKELEDFEPEFSAFMKRSPIKLIRPTVGQIETRADVLMRVLDIAQPTVPLPNYINNNNIVLHLQHRSISVMLTGDLGFEEETRILRRWPSVRSTILKLAHHAGAGSNGPKWMRQVTPEVAVAPMPAWLSPDPRGVSCAERIKPYIGRFLRTWESGHIEVTSDGRSYRVVTEKNLA
ncbi:MAG: ComEC/Rec2 family competence protein [Armatimonadota bacterium]